MTARCVTSFTDRLGWFATLFTVSMDQLVMERRIFVGFLSCFIRSSVRVRWRALFSFFFRMVPSEKLAYFLSCDGWIWSGAA